MDPNLLALVPQAGIYGVLVLVIIYLLRSNTADRKQYREALTTARNEYTAEIKRLEERHLAELTSVRKELTELKDANAKVLAELESERKARWQAEDDAARERRRRETLERELTQETT